MIVPEFKGRRAGYWNKNEWGIDWRRSRDVPAHQKDLSDAANSQALCDFAKACLGVDYLYGGWMEDRSPIWADTYLKESGKFVHLAQDIWVPAGTVVAADRAGTVLHIEDDTKTFGKGGWGTRVMLLLDSEPIVLLYGHLAPPPVVAGHKLRQGEVFALVGTPEQNGSWAPHIHVQAMSTESAVHFLEHPDELDGYGLWKDMATLAREFPDPIHYINLV